MKNSAGRGGCYEKIPPVPGTNQIAGFDEFLPLTCYEKDKGAYNMCC